MNFRLTGTARWVNHVHNFSFLMVVQTFYGSSFWLINENFNSLVEIPNNVWLVKIVSLLPSKSKFFFTMIFHLHFWIFVFGFTAYHKFLLLFCIYKSKFISIAWCVNRKLIEKNQFYCECKGFDNTILCCIFFVWNFVVRIHECC